MVMLCAKGGGERGVVADVCVRTSMSTYVRTNLSNILTFSLFPSYSPLYPPVSITIYSSIIPAFSVQRSSLPSFLSPTSFFFLLSILPSTLLPYFFFHFCFFYFTYFVRTRCLLILVSL